MAERHKGNQRRRLFLPIEIKRRELHGKVLFALMAAEGGYDVLLGGQREFMRRLGRWDRGIYLDKSVTVSKVDWFQRCRRLGNTVAAWDEEGLVFRDETIYRKNRCCPEALEQVACLLAWGGVQAEAILGAHTGMADRVRVTGNPRFDLLRPEFREFYRSASDALRHEHGRIILVNTNFGFANHFKGKEEANRMVAQYAGADEEYVQGWYRFQREGFDAFMKALPVLSTAFPGHTLVVRPSPSENRKPWVRKVGPLPNTLCSDAGNAIEWIMAADAVVHFNCTTGVEAFLLGVPAIAYRPVPSPTYESELPNAVSDQVEDVESLVERVRRTLEGERVDEAVLNRRMQTAHRYICAMDGPSAGARILKALDELRVPKRTRSTLERLDQIKREAWPMVARLRERETAAETRYERQKFPGLGVDEVLDIKTRFCRVTGRFDSIVIKPFGRDCVTMTLET